MASKYYNPRLASSVAAAKQAGFFDAGKSIAEGFKTAFEGASPYVMGALKEYQKDVEEIYDINFDSNGISLDKIEDLTNFVKQQKQNAFQARQKGILPGKEATGEALLNVQGAAKVAKYHGNVAQQIQSFLQDPDQVSEANEKAALPMLSSIANAKIDYTDKEGKFFVLADGTKLSMKDLENELGGLIVTPDEAYNEFFDYADTITPKKESYEGTTYYTFDEMDSNKIKTKAYSLIDKYGKDFVWDALSNSSPFKGVTVADFIDPKLNLQTKSKSEMENVIANTYKLDINNKPAIFDKAKELVAEGYTKAAKNMYPTRDKILKPSPQTPPESKNFYGLTPADIEYVDSFLDPILKNKGFNEGAAQLIKRTTGGKTKIDPKTNYFQILDDNGEVYKEYDLLKSEDVERLFKDIYGGTEKQATGANMRLVAPYAFDKINKFFNPKNSLPLFK